MRDSGDLNLVKPSFGPGPAVLAFDVGGTDIKAALVDREGTILELIRSPTPLQAERSAEVIVRSVAEIARKLSQSHPEVEPVAVGLLVPGQVDEDRGIAVSARNLGWHNAPLRDLTAKAIGLPIAFGHDVTGAGIAEFRLGAARPFDNVVVVTIGTGIAAAIFLDGQIRRSHGHAGEIGHVIVATEPDCSCGLTGCLESVSSASAITRRYNQLSGKSLPRAGDVVALALGGDAQALEVWNSALDGLAVALANVVALLGPEAIVLGGGLSAAGAQFFDEVTKRMNLRLSFHRRPYILPAAFGADAGVVGAAIQARDLNRAPR